MNTTGHVHFPAGHIPALIQRRLLIVIGTAQLELAQQASPPKQQRREGLQQLLMHRAHQAGQAIQGIIPHNACKAAGKHGTCPGRAHEQGYLQQLLWLILDLPNNHL